MRFNLVVLFVILLSFYSCGREEKTVYDFPLEQSLKSDKEVIVNNVLGVTIIAFQTSTNCSRPSHMNI